MIVLGRTSIGRYGQGDVTYPWNAPVNIFGTGYGVIGDAIVIPVAVLPGVSVGDADAATGDWREFFQSLCLLAHDWLTGFAPQDAPLTVRATMIEDWVRNDARFGRHMKRSIQFQFVVNNPPANVAGEV